jgi:uncharacterized protein
MIDCHMNCGWDVNNIRKNLFPAEQTFRQVLLKMNMAGIKQAIILPFPSPGGQFNHTAAWYDLENHYLIQAAEFSKRFIPFPGVNPADPRSVTMIRQLAITHNISGIKFSHQIPMGFSIDKLIGHPLMKIVQKYKLIMMIHTGTGKERGAENVHGTLPYAIKVVKKYPEVNFIVCHLGRLHRSLLEAFELPNLYFDTSGLALYENWLQFVAKDPLPELKNINPVDVIERLVEWGYGDKIIFGSDEPYTSYSKQIDHIMNANIPEHTKNKIMGRNMKKLLELRGV